MSFDPTIPQANTDLDALPIRNNFNALKTLIDATPNYTDTQPFPGTKTIWTYKAIYRADDAEVGIWSAPVSVVVGAGS